MIKIVRLATYRSMPPTDRYNAPDPDAKELAAIT